MSASISKQSPNERVIRTLYSHAEGNAKDTPKFVSLFADGGYFYDVGAGKKYYGADIGVTVDIYATAFPDMHRELYSVYVSGDVIVVELFPQRDAQRRSCPAGGNKCAHWKRDTCALLRCLFI